MSLILFDSNMYVDGLEKHLLETADIDARTVMQVTVPLIYHCMLMTS